MSAKPSQAAKLSPEQRARIEAEIKACHAGKVWAPGSGHRARVVVDRWVVGGRDVTLVEFAAYLSTGVLGLPAGSVSPQLVTRLTRKLFPGG